MPQIIIDGRHIEAAAGKSIIEAALDNGITIPHFCWHPALTVAGNCRMCLVNVGNHKKDTDGSLMFNDQGEPVVQWFPKMQIACATPVSEGMIVDTVSNKTEQAQHAVMEFLLINHPLDCPICDEAGQCKLQEYAFNHSKGKSRFDEQKTQKEKRVELGPNVLFDGERCISCSRCIRYAEEVAEQPVLSFVQRGDKVTIRTFPDTTFDSPYSMNVIDICPVGALTSIDFRFKARVWEMSFSDSICTGCARGCNVSVGVMNNQVLRYEPRTNMHVNEYWMCDYGRLTQPARTNDGRISGARIRQNATLTPVSWQEAYAEVARILANSKPSQVVVLGSAHCSNEDNYALARLAHEVIKTNNVDAIKHLDKSFADNKLRVSETAANAIGSHVMGIAPKGGHTVEQLESRIRSGDVRVLIVLEDSLEQHSESLAVAAASVEYLIVLTTHETVSAQQAHVVLPISAITECDGTLTTTLHRVQRFEAAVVTKENERRMGMNMSRWDKFGAPNDRWTNGERRDCKPAWKHLASIAALMGADWQFTAAERVFMHATQHIEQLKGMSYELLSAYQGIVLGKAHEPEPQAVVYQSHTFKPQ
jgi:NADH-quinone oxidoreductase subunit G